MYGLNSASRLAFVVCLAGLGLTGNATAQALQSLSSSPVSLVANSSGGFTRAVGVELAAARTWAASGGMIAANDAMSIATRAGPAAINAVSSVTMRSAAIAVGRCLMGAGPLCAAAGAAAALYTGYRIYSDATHGLTSDPGAPAPMENQWCYAASSICSGDPDGAINAFFATQSEQYREHVEAGPFCNGPMQYATSCSYDTRGPSGTRNRTVGRASVEGACPKGPNGNNGAKGLDGLCPTFVNSPSTPEQAADKVLPTITPGMAVPALKEALELGKLTLPADVTLTGPETVTGQPQTSVTQNPAGQAVTVTKTPTAKLQYTPLGVDVTDGEVVASTDASGATTTTVTTGATPAKESDLCALHPEAVACLKLGAAPSDVVPTLSRDLTFSAESVSMPSGCPAPQAFGSLSMSYEPACDTARSMRPFVLIGSAFAALLMLLSAVRSI